MFVVLQFRPDGPFYDANDIGWIFRDGRQHVCLAQDVRVGDLLPNCDIRDEMDDSIRVLIPVNEILEVRPCSSSRTMD